MWIRTTSLSAPSVLNTPGVKATFYIFHVLPEWVVILMLYGDNVRKIFGTGLVGDWRRVDETDKQREKREKQEAKRKERREKDLVDTGEAEKQGQASEDGVTAA